MRLIAINANADGTRKMQMTTGDVKVPDGWFPVPDNIETVGFPYGIPTVEITDGVPALLGWAADTESTEQAPTPAPTPQSDPMADHDEMIAELTERVVNLELK